MTQTQPIRTSAETEELSTSDAPSAEMSQSVEGLTNAKKQKKKQNKKKNKVKREVIKEWQQRCLSPDFHKVMELESQSDINLTNLNPQRKQKAKEQLSSDEGSSKRSSSGDENSDEDFEDFHKDGYHPAHQNEIIDHKYLLLKKLGWGHFSTVWLAIKLQDKQLYALKIQKAAQKYTESALEEEEILYDVALNYKNAQWEKSVQKYLRQPSYEVTRADTHNLQMFDQFFHNSQNGKHSVMAFEVLGKNLLALIKKYDYKGIPIKIVREICKQCLMGLDYLHRVCGIIHTDLKPENVVFGLNERQKFELLNNEVLNTKLVELYDVTEPMILSKKQAKNQKKKDRKKKNKQSANQEQSTSTLQPSEADQDDQDDGDEVNIAEETQYAQEQPKITKGKSRAIIEKMSAKLDKEEKEARSQHIMKLKQRSRSAPTLTSSFTKALVFDESQQLEDGVFVFDHPLWSYKAYVKKYVKNDFELLKIKHHNDKSSYEKAMKAIRPRNAMRVHSQQDTYRSRLQKRELKPKTLKEITKEEDTYFNIRMCDMGNACYVDKHYSDVIQTREYRSPEVMLQGEYDESADVWSLACMVFELVTGDYLFDPKKGKTFKKNDDHLALISELIGEVQGADLASMKDTCELWEDYFEPANKNATRYKLKRIKSLKPWPLQKVLIEKYKMREVEAKLLAKFLLRCLKWSPKNRASARDLLGDMWLKVGTLDDNSHMSRTYLNEWRRATGEKVESSESGESGDSSSSGGSGDQEDQSDSDQSGSGSGSAKNDKDNSWTSDSKDGSGSDDGETLKQTLMNTVPNASGLNYDPKQETGYTANSQA